MPEPTVVDNPANGDYSVAVDDTASGAVQLVKLAFSANSNSSPVTADASGLLVNLGTNNDVTVTSGTVTLGAGTANIGDVDVLTLPALPAGANAIGTVGVTSVVPGTTATSLGKAEDAVHASGDTGVMALGVAATTSAARAASGDYVPPDMDVNGRQRIIGAVAQDAAVAGDVVLVGGRASAAIPTAMSTDGDAVYSYMDRAGRQVVAQKAGTATSSNVSGSASNVTLLAANTSRLGATFYNDSTAILYLKLGTTASTSSFTVKLFPEDFFEVPFGYTGIVDGIWASAAGACRVVELT